MASATANLETESSEDVRKMLAGKYLTFALGDEEYGLPVLRVREIIKMMDITVVPQVPHHVKGVINLRGKVIPVVDLRLKFGFAGNRLHRAHVHHRRADHDGRRPGADGHRRRLRVGSAQHRRGGDRRDA